jgi:formate hydrogenlyase subunit 6/NADH:ubiquinone oxidoreductase subunit I
MAEIQLTVGSTVALRKTGLDKLLANLLQMGYRVLGPQIQDGAIVYKPLKSTAELPKGYISEQDAASYRLVYSGHRRFFDVTPGAQSWKQFFFPAFSELARYKRDEHGRWQLEEKEVDLTPLALFGVFPCDLAAIQVQDHIFLREEWKDPIYWARRQSAFILAVDCLHPCGTGFCASMGTGPKAKPGFDLCLTELEDVFLVEVGSEAGRMVMEGVSVLPTSAFWLQAAQKGLEDANTKMGRNLPDPQLLPDLLLNHLDALQWDDVARRCMSCASCTQVCPTCFCWDTRDSTDLNGLAARRERVWDSCFNPDYSYIVGGNSRPNTRSRYRQWLTHKFGSWYAQFGTSGCVGCGRCITWCPAKIDVTAELRAIREEVQS